MKNIAVALMVVIGAQIGFARNQDTSVVTASASTVAIVEWPDYSSWQVTGTYPFTMPVRNQDLDNKYITGLEVIIGTQTIRVDNVESPSLAVGECMILGKGIVVRALLVITPFELMPKDVQMLVHGKWVSGRRGGLQMYLTDPAKLLEKGELVGVLLVLDSLDSEKPPLELRLENKEKRP